jgi:hypothetical protein
MLTSFRIEYIQYGEAKRNILSSDRSFPGHKRIDEIIVVSRQFERCQIISFSNIFPFAPKFETV